MSSLRRRKSCIINSEMAVKKRSTACSANGVHTLPEHCSFIYNKHRSGDQRVEKKNDFEDITHGGITKHCSLLFSKSPGRNHVDDVHKL